MNCHSYCALCSSGPKLGERIPLRLRGFCPQKNATCGVFISLTDATTSNAAPSPCTGGDGCVCFAFKKRPPATGLIAFQYVRPFFIGRRHVQLYERIQQRRLVLAESERKGDLQSLIGSSRYLTIGPDALRSLPEASPGHQEPSGRAKGGAEEHQNTPARCVCERMLMDARKSSDTKPVGPKMARRGCGADLG